MRLLAEIVVIGALIYLGWEKPFRDRLRSSLTRRVQTNRDTNDCCSTPAATTVR